MVWAAFVVLNLLTWGVYRWDKARAGRRGARRVPERTLLGLAAVGGFVGAGVAMYAHRQRHKANKAAFVWRYRVVLCGWLVGLVVWLGS